MKYRYFVYLFILFIGCFLISDYYFSGGLTAFETLKEKLVIQEGVNEIDEQQLPLEDYQVTINRSISYSPLEPSVGCYLGSYTLSNSLLDYSTNRFDERTGKKHLFNVYYLKAGNELPKEWFIESLAYNKVPYIFILKGDLWGDDLRKALNKSIGSFENYQDPLFLDLYPMTVDNPQLGQFYTKQYIASMEQIKNACPEAVFVYSMDFKEWKSQSRYMKQLITEIDWLGVRMRLDSKEDLLLIEKEFTDFYIQMKEIKPLIISELGLQKYNVENHQYQSDLVVNGLKRIYGFVEEYPRLKGINYINSHLDESVESLGDYSITENKQLTETYQKIISSNYFVKEVMNPLSSGVKGSTVMTIPVKAIYYHDQLYIEKGFFTDRYLSIQKTVSKIIYGNRPYYSLEVLKSNLSLNYSIDDHFKLIRFY